MDTHYSRFPAGCVGLALLLLRLVGGLGLLAEGMHPGAGASSAPTSALLLDVAIVASATMLMLGLRTSLAGSAGAMCTAGTALFGAQRWNLSGTEMDAWLCLLALLFFLSSSLALLGAGSHSLDARLYGWRRIRLSSRKSDWPFSWDIFVT